MNDLLKYPLIALLLSMLQCEHKVNTSQANRCPCIDDKFTLYTTALSLENIEWLDSSFTKDSCLWIFHCKMPPYEEMIPGRLYGNQGYQMLLVKKTGLNILEMADSVAWINNHIIKPLK